ncbi:MAG: hypothetical protein GTO40_30500 [Deltaproteobacteria bacterium]|nr:hypothetical protein [Deltaproteobacteria bacterium]
MARDEEQHACILLACKAIVDNFQDSPVKPEVVEEKADRLEAQMSSYLNQGTPAISVEDAFKIALEVESSELDAIYSELLSCCGAEVSKTMEHVGVPASVQRRKLAAAVRRFTSDPGLRAAAERL